jgi:hypothetical protein
VNEPDPDGEIDAASLTLAKSNYGPRMPGKVFLRRDPDNGGALLQMKEHEVTALRKRQKAKAAEEAAKKKNRNGPEQDDGSDHPYGSPDD